MKEAFEYCRSKRQIDNCFVDLWKIKTPPRRAGVVWKLLHNRVPTDDVVLFSKTSTASCCNLCQRPCCFETQQHLFFECSFSVALWNWIRSIFNVTTISIRGMFTLVRNYDSSSQVKNLLWVAVINNIWLIWNIRNQLRFQYVVTSFEQATSKLKVLIKESGGLNKGHMRNKMEDLLVLRFFKVNGRAVKAPKIIEVKWQPPLYGWFKINADGCSLGNPGQDGCGVVFRISNCVVVGSLAQSIGVDNSVSAEFWGAIFAFRIACSRGMRHIWFECDSMHVIGVLSDHSLVPWNLAVHWANCMKFLSTIQFRYSHIHREGNAVANLLAKWGASTGSQWCNEPPHFIRSAVGTDRSSLSVYHFR